MIRVGDRWVSDERKVYRVQRITCPTHGLIGECRCDLVHHAGETTPDGDVATVKTKCHCGAVVQVIVAPDMDVRRGERELEPRL